MKLGHIETQNNSKITGNRVEVLYSIYDDELNSIDLDFLDYCELAANLDFLHIPYTMKFTEYYDDYEDKMHTSHDVNTETLVFHFIDNTIVYIGKKYNILDDLREKYNLPY